MKKKYLLLLPVLLLMAVPWACNDNSTGLPSYPLNSIQPVPNGSQVCGFTPIPNSPNTFTPTPVPSPGIPTSTPTATPPIVVLAQPTPFNGPTTVLKSLAQFQAYYSTVYGSTFSPWVPPVDFSRQMVLNVVLTQGCDVIQQIDSVCEGPNQITVNLMATSFSHPNCASDELINAPVVVNQSDLPVVWQFNETVNY